MRSRRDRGAAKAMYPHAGTNECMSLPVTSLFLSQARALIGARAGRRSLGRTVEQSLNKPGAGVAVAQGASPGGAQHHPLLGSVTAGHQSIFHFYLSELLSTETGLRREKPEEGEAVLSAPPTTQAHPATLTAPVWGAAALGLHRSPPLISRAFRWWVAWVAWWVAAVRVTA